MPKYAATTKVPAERTRDEIERVLERYGANEFAYMKSATRVLLAFQLNGRNIKLEVPLPDRGDPEFNEYTRNYSTYQRVDSAVDRLWQQAVRQRWRALLLLIKAKLEAVDSGITTVEDEFLASTLTRSGLTIGEIVREQGAYVVEEGRMPPLLEAPRSQ